VARAFQAERAAEPGSPGPLRILSSPRTRARETAAIVRDGILPIPGDIEIHDELGGETAIPLSLIEAALGSGIDTMLVGHQPVVEELVQQLLGATRMRAGFSTATVIGLDRSPDGSGWTLATHLDPSKVPG
jgi:phosphohistidine phosphatase SixA